MRRFPSSPPAFLSHRPPAAVLSAAHVIAVPLALITPQVGGGVEPREPDHVGPIRLSAVRGQLRQWWRWIHLPLHGADRAVSRERENKLWGGVLPDDDAGRGSTVASRVRLSLQKVEHGEVIPAGYHRLKPGGGTRPIPELEGAAQGLDYALFPLQIDDQSRRGRTGDVPTRPVRVRLSFTLVLSLVRRSRPVDEDLDAESQQEFQRLDDEDAQEVLRALWAWIHFGGLGARTRRGLGALTFTSPAESQGGDWLGAMKNDFQKLPLEKWLGCCKEIFGTIPGSRAARAALWVGPKQADPGAAHRLLIGRLKSFRQAPVEARSPGKNGPFGRSRWPEPNVLRALRDRLRPPPRWDHDPGAAALADARRDPAHRQQGLPRAAFGLPLEVQFKDPGDKAAAASVLPDLVGVDRLASPLLMRPIALTEGAYPVLLRLPLELPDGVRDPGDWTVRVRFKDGSGIAKAPVFRSGGAEPPVSGRLLATTPKGDAVAAFLDWMKSTERFVCHVPGSTP